jgi:carbamoyl-phosphate synthase large subunit
MGVMEHIEPAGIHSGDSHSVLPPFSLSDEAIEKMKEHTVKIAKALKVKGLINIQFVVKRALNDKEKDEVYVIEANPRASRTTPFICKAYQIPYLNYATKIMIGQMKVKDIKDKEKLEGFAIKEPVFSFNKFPNVKKELGPEMKSTGEAIRFISNIRDPHFRNLFKMKSMYLSR